MRNIKGLVAIFAFALLVSLPTVASAQWGGNNRNRDRDDDYYGRNNGYNLKNTVKRLKNDSKDFAKFVDRDLDNSRYNDRNREDRMNQLADAFKRAADELEDEYDSRNPNRSSREAQQVINLASQIDREMRRARLSSDVENYWNNIKRQVNEVANAYGYNYNNNNRNNRNNRGNGDWRNRIPFPF